jgi:uncharacterized protein YndB with AHSA1/START domain
MIRAEHRFVLPVPPAEAFALLSDPAREGEWQSACVGTRLLNGEARTGCRYEITFQLVGKTMPFTAEITAFEPGARSEFTSIDGPFGYVGGYRYTEVEGGKTSVHWRFDVEPGDYFGITPLPLVRKLLVAQVKRDSGRLADRLERRAAHEGWAP